MRDAVGDHDFLEQAERDEAGCDAELPLPARHVDLPAELMHHLRPARQRPRDRLREEDDVECVAIERIERRLGALQVGQIHDVVEGEERDAERQPDVERRERRAEHEAEIGQHKVRVFEKREHADIEHDHERQHRLPFHPAIGDRGKPVDRDRGDQQQDEGRTAPGIERQRQRDLHADPQRRIGIDQAVDQQRRRQEDQKKGVVVEQHRFKAASSPALAPVDDAQPVSRSGAASPGCRSMRRAIFSSLGTLTSQASPSASSARMKTKPGSNSNQRRPKAAEYGKA